MKIRVKLSGDGWTVGHTGKGKFAMRLCDEWRKQGVEVTDDLAMPVDIDLQIGRFHYEPSNYKKVVLRIGNAHIDTRSDYVNLNAPKTDAMKRADAIVYQSKYSKEMCDRFVLRHDKPHAIIHNGAAPSGLPPTGSKHEINFCAVTRDWTPQKRLKSIIKGWLSAGLDNACLWIVGNTHGLNKQYKHDSLTFMGLIDDKMLERLYRLCTTMIHIVYLDACPNSVCEALANGCQVLCNDNGGTQELIDSYGRNGRILALDQKKYEFGTTDLQHPPKINRALLATTIKNYADVPKHNCFENIKIENVARQYLAFFETLL